MKTAHTALVASATLLASFMARAQAPAADHFVGEIGGMAVTSQPLVKGGPNSTTALPYVYGDWGRFYARVDTLGMRLVPLQDGHLELAVRVSTEGIASSKTAYPAAGDRSAPLPMGLGTFQRTSLGGVFAYALYDPQSRGQFGELNWAGKIDVGAVKIYPQLGVQYRSSDYVRHLYGITAAQSQATGLAVYQPGASVTPMATLQAAVALSGPWSLQLQTRYRHLDAAVARSPLVNRSSQVTGFAALTYTLN